MKEQILGFVYCFKMEGSCWCQTDSANDMPCYGVNIGY